MKSTTLITLLAGIVLLGACKSKNYEAVNDSRSADTAAIAVADSAAMNKLVKTADIHFKVKDVQQTGENISALTIKENGMVMHHDMTSAEQQTNDIRLNDDSVMRVSAFNTIADMTVKIPADKIEDFLNSVSHMSMYVNVRRMNIEDKSLDYLSARMKLDNRKEFVAAQKTGKVVIKDPNAVLNLKDDMVDGLIDNRKIDDAVKYSTISLSFYQSNTINKEIIANDDASSYHLPFWNSTVLAFGNGWFYFNQLLIILIDMWVFILIGAGAWLGWKIYKRKSAPQPANITA